MTGTPMKFSMKQVSLRYFSRLINTVTVRNVTSSACICNNSASRSTLKPFSVIDGAVNKSSEEFLWNTEASKALTDQYLEILAKSQAGGGEKAITRHVKQHKKLLVSDRVKLLLDDEDDFLELCPIAGHNMEYGDIARAGGLMGLYDVVEFLAQLFWRKPAVLL